MAIVMERDQKDDIRLIDQDHDVDMDGERMLAST